MGCSLAKRSKRQDNRLKQLIDISVEGEQIVINPYVFKHHMKFLMRARAQSQGLTNSRNLCQSTQLDGNTKMKMSTNSSTRSQSQKKNRVTFDLSFNTVLGPKKAHKKKKYNLDEIF